MFCSTCGKEINDKAVVCVGCGVPVPNAAPMPKPIPVSNQVNMNGNVVFQAKPQFATNTILAPAEQPLRSYPVALMVIFTILTFGIFGVIKISLFHGNFPKKRYDDPSSGKAVGFMFVPIYNFYWQFFNYLRLTDRINESLDENNFKLDYMPREFVLMTVIAMMIPYLNILGFFAFVVLAGMFQAKINLLANQRYMR